MNEINTIPGFTLDQHVPQDAGEATGLPFAVLLDRLSTLARERHARQARLRTRYQP